MFSSKQSNSKLKKIHERALRIISRNCKSDYSSLLEQNNECTFHVRNLQALMTEIYKTIADLNPAFMKELFIRQDTPYRLKCNLRLKIPSVRAISYCPESIYFRGSHLWNSLQNSYKECDSLHVFKSKIRQWNGSGCTCKLRK